MVVAPRRIGSKGVQAGMAARHKGKGRRGVGLLREKAQQEGRLDHPGRRSMAARQDGVLMEGGCGARRDGCRVRGNPEEEGNGEEAGKESVMAFVETGSQKLAES